MAKSFIELQQESNRRAILELLAEDSDYTINAHLLQEGLRLVGVVMSFDALNTRLAWMSEQGLVTLEKFSGMTVAKLTQRGLDVVQGACVVPGVARVGLS